MNASALEIVPLERHHVNETAPVLAEAFSEDPGSIVIVKGDRNRRLRVLRRSYAAQMDLNLPQGVSSCAFLDGEIVAGMIISAPNKGAIRTLGMLKILWRMLMATGPAILWRGLQNAMDDERHRPKEPNYYLETIGVDPRYQRLGIGGALLSNLTRRADREGVLVYLSTTEPNSIPFYEKFGFEAKSRSIMLGIPNWHMVRQPREW